jgi:hypothetical protein
VTRYTCYVMSSSMRVMKECKRDSMVLLHCTLASSAKHMCCAATCGE